MKIRSPCHSVYCGVWNCVSKPHAGQSSRPSSFQTLNCSSPGIRALWRLNAGSTTNFGRSALDLNAIVPGFASQIMAPTKAAQRCCAVAGDLLARLRCRFDHGLRWSADSDYRPLGSRMTGALRLSGRLAPRRGRVRRHPRSAPARYRPAPDGRRRVGTPRRRSPARRLASGRSHRPRHRLRRE